MLTTTISRDEMIARLNDRCRTGLDRTSRTVITKSCLATFGKGNKVDEIVAQAKILAAIRKHTYPTNDKTRDRGSLTFEGETVYFTIDAYDLELTDGSPDPANASVTRRVMTIMLREDL